MLEVSQDERLVAINLRKSCEYYKILTILSKILKFLGESAVMKNIRKQTERKTGHGYGSFAGKIFRSYCKENKC